MKVTLELLMLFKKWYDIFRTKGTYREFENLANPRCNQNRVVTILKRELKIVCNISVKF